MTKQLFNVQETTPFGLWLRTQPDLDSIVERLSIQNLDWIIHCYSGVATTCEHIMLIEEKRNGNTSDFAQRDTLLLLDQVCHYAHGIQVTTERKTVRTFLYYGLHVLTFINSTPDDGPMRWDGKPITREDLLLLLRFKIDPYSPTGAGNLDRMR